MAVNFYQTEIDDLIAYFDPTPDDYTNDDAGTFNINKAKITGAEIVVTARYVGWDFATNITVQKPEDVSGDENDGKTLIRRPETTVDFDASGALGNFRVGANIFIRGKSYDDPKNEKRLSGFATLNLRAETRVHKNWSVAFKVNNALDKEYETAGDYPQDGRNFLATLRYIP